MFKTVLAIIFFSLGVVYFSGCSGAVYIESWKDPDYKGSKFNVIMVEVITKEHNANSYQDSMLIRTFENNVAKSLKDNGLTLIPSHLIFNIDSSYTDSSYTEILEKNLIDGVLTLEYKGTDVQKTFNAGNTLGFPWGRRIFRRRRHIEVHRYLDFTCSLEKVESGKDIWKADAKVNAQGNLKESASELGEKLKDELIDEGLIY